MYCVVARTAPTRLARTFDELHADDGIVVVHERRIGDRRTASRRAVAAIAPQIDRRRIHGFDGRRVEDRRALTVDVPGPLLPRGLRRHAAGVHYCERVAPRDRDAADAEIARLVLRVQGGETELFEEVYRRAFSDVFGYFHVVLSDHAEAEDATQQVFVSALDALPGFELRRGTPFRAWLFRIARHEALRHLNRRKHQLVEDPDVLSRRREALASSADAVALEWVSDPDLLGFIDRLSATQRQVLALRFMLGMRTPEIASVLDKTEQAVRHLESRALRFLQQRLVAVGRGPTRQSRAAMVMCDAVFPVMRARRMALGPGRPGEWLRRTAWR